MPRPGPWPSCFIFTALVTGISILFLKQKITFPEIIALFLALAGTVCVIGFTSGGKTLGIILGISAALIYSAYIITGSRIMPKTDVITSSTVIMMSAAAVFTVAVMVRGSQLPTHIQGWSAVGAIIIVSTILAIITFFEGLKRIGPVHSSMLSTIEPVVTILLAWMAFGEGLTYVKFIGAAMILSAGIVLSREPQKIVERDSP